MLRRCAVLKMRAISDHQRQVIERRSAHTERLTSREASAKREGIERIAGGSSSNAQRSQPLWRVPSP